MTVIYVGAMEGIDRNMNIDMEAYLRDPYTREALIAEAAIQLMADGAYVDLTDIKKSFQSEHWSKIVSQYAQVHYGIK